ncbi:MAG TPA: Panacea domain-containing protein [candidate division Zixibacteria bacterium]|nr:Panacea domain-containing protein [candidate division Zixibacteria bacterium]
MGKMTQPKFREDKVTQVAALFLKMSGGHMNHLKLMKLLYLADRESLIKWGRPIVFDYYVSMGQGPVLSQTLNLMHGETPAAEFWNKLISPSQNYEVRLLGEFDTGQLSKAEEKLVQEIYSKFGQFTQWQLVEYTHTLPEYKDPNGSSVPILYKEVLKGAGKSDKDISSIINELDNIGLMDRIMFS